MKVTNVNLRCLSKMVYYKVTNVAYLIHVFCLSYVSQMFDKIPILERKAMK